jgi:hypothetical protein
MKREKYKSIREKDLGRKKKIEKKERKKGERN